MDRTGQDRTYGQDRTGQMDSDRDRIVTVTVTVTGTVTGTGAGTGADRNTGFQDVKKWGFKT